MTITNKLGLPQPLVEAVRNDPYDNAGTLTVTTLLKPAQANAIIARHRDDIVEDAADRIWALMGQSVHTVLERAAAGLDPGWIIERRFVGEIAGEKVSGAADIIEIPARTVWDYKQTSGWAVMDAMKGGKSDWHYQLSVLAMLAREGRYIEVSEDAFGLKVHREVEGAPIEITHGKIVAIVRDWTATMAAKNPDWPQQQVAVIDMEIMPDDQTREWLEMRIEGYRHAMSGGAIPCTDEERWFRPGKWAVYKGGNKTAAKLADSEEELSAWIFSNRGRIGSDYRIEERPGKYARCENYCAAAPWCPQFQATKGDE